MQNNLLRRFHFASFTPGGAPFGRLPGVIDMMPLQGILNVVKTSGICPELEST